jgi:hypothetical protein
MQAGHRIARIARIARSDEREQLARPETARRPKALFICGSVNQTRQMHQIAAALPEVDASFTPYYCDAGLESLRWTGLLDITILGWRWRKRTMRYLRQHRLPMDFEGKRRGHIYDLIVTCSDVIVPRAVRGKKLVAVQEGMTDPERVGYWARRLIPVLPRWIGGTVWTGTSNLYTYFCVASDGFKELFVRRGADPARVVVTGIPNFDDCARYRLGHFGERGFVLVCTSDTRETLKLDSQRRFIRRARAIADGRRLIFKLHPNENWQRSTRLIKELAPDAQVLTDGSAEEMVAQCDVLICQYSTLAFVGLALGKEVHSSYDLEELRRLLPIQGGAAARNIAEVCRTLLSTTGELPAGSEAPT